MNWEQRNKKKKKKRTKPRPKRRNWLSEELQPEHFGASSLVRRIGRKPIRNRARSVSVFRPVLQKRKLHLLCSGLHFPSLRSRQMLIKQRTTFYLTNKQTNKRNSLFLPNRESSPSCSKVHLSCPTFHQALSEGMTKIIITIPKLRK
jgi:hypothetical protein